MTQENEIDRLAGIDPTKTKRFPKPQACVWYKGAEGQCGKPLAYEDPCFCSWHRRMANESKR